MVWTALAWLEPDHHAKYLSSHVKSNPGQLFGCGAEVGKRKLFFVWSEKLLKSEEVLQDMLADQVWANWH